MVDREGDFTAKDAEERRGKIDHIIGYPEKSIEKVPTPSAQSVKRSDLQMSTPLANQKRVAGVRGQGARDFTAEGAEERRGKIFNG